MADVFMSYAHRDADIAVQIRMALHRLGVEPFDPGQKIPAGVNWREAVKTAIKKAKAVVLVVGSPESAASSWLSYEAGIATALGKPVLVLVSHIYPVNELALDLSSEASMPFDPENPEATARAIVDTLRATV